LVQRRVDRLLELGDRNVEKPRTVYARQAHENSKNKAVPRKRPQRKEAAQFRGKQLERRPAKPDGVGGVHGRQAVLADPPERVSR
jgi:hypothetical protein